MKYLLRDVIKILDTNSITYWAVCGTLIGAYRHQGFIPWDDDIDLGIMLDDIPKLLSLRSYLNDNNFQLFQQGGAYKIARKKFIPFPFIDLIVMKEDNKKLKLCYPLNTKGKCTFDKSIEWPKEVYNIDRVFPLKKIQFEDFTINIPKDDNLIEETYNNCKTVAFHDKTLSKINNHYTYALLWKLGLNPWF
jgi:phosphorylcholine metabolism protein LicD